jgi:hypothetical protein
MQPESLRKKLTGPHKVLQESRIFIAYMIRIVYQWANDGNGLSERSAIPFI